MRFPTQTKSVSKISNKVYGGLSQGSWEVQRSQNCFLPHRSWHQQDCSKQAVMLLFQFLEDNFCVTALYYVSLLLRVGPICMYWNTNKNKIRFKQFKNLNTNLLIIKMKHFQKTKKINWPCNFTDLLSDMNQDKCESKCWLCDNTTTRPSGIWLWSRNKEFISIPSRVSIHKKLIYFSR